jgi:hypothetical protein
MHKDVKDFVADDAALDAVWQKLDVNRSGSLSMSEWQSWVTSRWPFVSSAVSNQAYRRTLASKFPLQTAHSKPFSDNVLVRDQLVRVVQTLPICSEAEAMFLACDSDGDRRVTSAELKHHARTHGLKLNADQLQAAALLLEKNSSFSGFCDWFLQQRGGDTAEEIAAVCCLLSCSSCC